MHLLKFALHTHIYRRNIFLVFTAGIYFAKTKPILSVQQLAPFVVARNLLYCLVFSSVAEGIYPSHRNQ
jgi:hypothetical protein